MFGVKHKFNYAKPATYRNPTHSYETEGNYTVTLTVTDDTGSTAADITTVSITKGETPNGNEFIPNSLVNPFIMTR